MEGSTNYFSYIPSLPPGTGLRKLMRPASNALAGELESGIVNVDDYVIETGSVDVQSNARVAELADALDSGSSE